MTGDGDDFFATESVTTSQISVLVKLGILHLSVARSLSYHGSKDSALFLLWKYLTEDLGYVIPGGWKAHATTSDYMGCYVWLKVISNFRTT